MTCLLRKDGGWWHTGTTASSIGTLMPPSNTGAIQVNDSSFIEKKEGHQQQQQRDFYSIAKNKGTDKVAALRLLEHCSKGEGKDCTRPGCKNPKCRPWGHYYHTMYQQHLGHLSTDDSAPFQFLEIGFYNGNGFDAYREFLPRAETHSMEISCIDEGPRSEGKWPWGNFAAKNSNYKTLLKQRRLHCGDANDVEFLHKIWTNEMNRTSAPPLKVVVDDGAHVAEHMAQSVFFWLPRLEPGGFLVVEDIQPIQEANKFRTQFLPQIMADLHYCGDPAFADGGPCFPTLQPLLHSIHCKMHICIFTRNDTPAQDLDLAQSLMPSTALDSSKCPSLT